MSSRQHLLDNAFTTTPSRQRLLGSVFSTTPLDGLENQFAMCTPKVMDQEKRFVNATNQRKEESRSHLHEVNTPLDLDATKLTHLSMRCHEVNSPLDPDIWTFKHPWPWRHRGHTHSFSRQHVATTPSQRSHPDISTPVAAPNADAGGSPAAVRRPMIIAPASLSYPYDLVDPFSFPFSVILLFYHEIHWVVIEYS